MISIKEKAGKESGEHGRKKARQSNIYIYNNWNSRQIFKTKKQQRQRQREKKNGTNAERDSSTWKTIQHGAGNIKTGRNTALTARKSKKKKADVSRSIKKR
jgi:hypothetical protein